MQIDERDLPYSGEDFYFTVDGGVRPIRIEVFIADKLHYETECPDPPCHEMTTIPIYATKGSVLRIVATDSSGARFERSFTIRASGGMPSGGGGMVPQPGGGTTSGAGG